jgi:hypothetical protein
VAVDWKFKKCFRWHEFFRILVFRDDPRDGIEHTRNPPRIQFESLFEVWFGIVTVFSFSSFSSGRSMANFGSSHFGSLGFGSSDFGNSAFGRSGFSNSLIGSNLSLIPSLLLGDLLRLGTSVFEGPGILGGSALSLAARSFGSGLFSNIFSQGGFAGGAFGFGRGGFGWGLLPRRSVLIVS